MSRIRVTLNEIEENNGKWRIVFKIKDLKHDSTSYGFTEFIYDSYELADKDVEIAKWLLLPPVSGHPSKPECVSKNGKNKIITWKSSPREHLTDIWNVIIAIADAGFASRNVHNKQYRGYQKSTQLDLSSKRHKVQSRAEDQVLVAMDLQTFDSWVRFQEQIELTEVVDDVKLSVDEETKAAVIVTQLLHPWSEVSSRRQAQFGKAFKRALQDCFHCFMPNASLREAVCISRG